MQITGNFSNSVFTSGDRKNLIVMFERHEITNRPRYPLCNCEGIKGATFWLSMPIQIFIVSNFKCNIAWLGTWPDTGTAATRKRVGFVAVRNTGIWLYVLLNRIPFSRLYSGRDVSRSVPHANRCLSRIRCFNQWDANF